MLQVAQTLRDLVDIRQLDKELEKPESLVPAIKEWWVVK